MNRQISLFTLSILMISVFIAMDEALAADDFLKVDINPEQLTVNTTETGVVEIKITNEDSVIHSYSILVDDSPDIGITLEKYKIVNLNPGETSTSKVFFSVGTDADPFPRNIKIGVSSTTKEDVRTSKLIELRVTRKSDVFLSEILVDSYILEPEECMEIKATVTNVGSQDGPFKLDTSIKSGSLIMERFDDVIDSVGSKSIRTVSNRYCFEKYSVAGDYKIESNLKTTLNKMISTKSITNITLKDYSKMVKEEYKKYTPFAQIKTITIKNEGNVIEKEYQVTETVSEFMSKFLYPEGSPTASEIIEGKIIYTWTIESLSPGEETTITYEVRFFSIWFTGLVLIIIVTFAFNYVYRPRISKTINFIGPLKRGKDISVLVEIKNSTLHEVKNVIVKDSIPNIAQLIQRFDTVKPTIKKAEIGTELEWKIKSLQPLEERVLTYRIEPVVDIIGSMRLPSAHMTYVDRKKKKKTATSKSVEIK